MWCCECRDALRNSMLCWLTVDAVHLERTAANVHWPRLTLHHSSPRLLHSLVCGVGSHCCLVVSLLRSMLMLLHCLPCAAAAAVVCRYWQRTLTTCKGRQALPFRATLQHSCEHMTAASTQLAANELCYITQYTAASICACNCSTHERMHEKQPSHHASAA